MGQSTKVCDFYQSFVSTIWWQNQENFLTESMLWKVSSRIQTAKRQDPCFIIKQRKISNWGKQVIITLRSYSNLIKKSRSTRSSRCLSPTFPSRTQEDTLRSSWKLLSQLVLMQPTIRLPLPRVDQDCSPETRQSPPSTATNLPTKAQPRHSLHPPHLRSFNTQQWRKIRESSIV